MPAFVYSGNTSIWNTTPELYRVEVFTDEDCLNTVFRGAITGAPAYVPRPIGPLGCPTDVLGLTAARSDTSSRRQRARLVHHGDGVEVKSNESDVSGAPAERRTPASRAGQVVKGAKVDLWDSNWSGGRYYWTVMPIERRAGQDESRRRSRMPRCRGDTTINVVDGTGIVAGDAVTVGSPPARTPSSSGRGQLDHARLPAIGLHRRR